MKQHQHQFLTVPNSARDSLNNSFGASRKVGASSTMNMSSPNSCISLQTSNTTTTTSLENKTFVKVIHGDQIDLMDFEGNIKDVSSFNNRDYAIQYLTPASSYIVVKIENATPSDSTTNNDKKYTPLLNEARINANMLKTLTILNTGKPMTAKDKAKLNREAKQRQLQAAAAAMMTLTSTATLQSNHQQQHHTATTSTNAISSKKKSNRS